MHTPLHGCPYRGSYHTGVSNFQQTLLLVMQLWEVGCCLSWSSISQDKWINLIFLLRPLSLKDLNTHLILRPHSISLTPRRTLWKLRPTYFSLHWQFWQIQTKSFDLHKMVMSFFPTVHRKQLENSPSPPLWIKCVISIIDCFCLK